jgi:tetratricopeptide (TPR) repeat protein
MKWLKFPVNHIIVIISLILVFASLQSWAADNLQFKIELDRDTFMLREPVWVDLYFINEGNQSVTLDCLDLYWQQLEIYLVNSHGDTLQYCGYVADGVCRAGPTVKPFETYHYYINLSENYGKGAQEYLPPTLRYFDENTYTLQMRHTGVSSNLIRFKVESPKGEEKLAYRLLKDASRSGFKYYDKDAQQVIGLFQELISKYPKSRYADLVYYELGGLYGLVVESEKTNEYLEKLILSFPNSHFSLKALPGLLQQMKEDEKIKFLKEIIKKQPKTKASDCAQEFLEDLKETDKPKN